MHQQGEAPDPEPSLAIDTLAAVLSSTGAVVLIEHQLRTDREGDLEHRARVGVAAGVGEAAAMCREEWSSTEGLQVWRGGLRDRVKAKVRVRRESVSFRGDPGAGPRSPSE